ncbi:hypothetical protein N0V88_002779 [Collariella sp. IMI 366227]|nr:hypothetical protein N0V88_002779 [Collariella sp. IMI 366227]
MPPFCLTNIPKILAQFRQYIALSKLSYLEGLKRDDELVWMTISAAMGYAQSRPDSLTADTLNLWAISRMIEIPWEICGPENLGISSINDTASPHHGKIPIPPIMDTQLDQIVIQNILTPLRAKMVEKFENLINPVKPEVWFDIYLSVFILLNHIERLAKHSVGHAKLHTMPRKYSNIPFLERAFHTAKSILARFHFVSHNSSLLTLDWSAAKTKAVARLTLEEVAFMRRTQEVVRRRQNDVRSLRGTHLYESTLYWSGQMYFGDFDTSPVRVVEVFEEGEGAVFGPQEFKREEIKVIPVLVVPNPPVVSIQREKSETGPGGESKPLAHNRLTQVNIPGIRKATDRKTLEVPEPWECAVQELQIVVRSLLQSLPLEREGHNHKLLERVSVAGGEIVENLLG